MSSEAQVRRRCAWRPPVVALVFLGLAAAFSSASERPKIGLVLSGGGARGSAHVGVLKVMEELRIPVDYVVGTSMGSIVGGLYASGLSPADMEEGFRTVDWSTAFNDKPDRKRISFRLKEDDAQALLPFELGVGKAGLSTRSGIIGGQKINLILRGMVLHTVGIDDFDELQIPYRAVAADLQTGDAVVLDHGELAVAMRASMSVPGVFTPVELEGRRLIDGGPAMNLPIRVAQQMGAERIIAVDVGTPPDTDTDSLSTFGVVAHTFSVLAKRNVREELELLSEGDLLIVPELDDIASSDFDKLLQGVAVGEEAARRAEDELRSFSVSEEDFAEYLDGQRTKPDEQRSAVMIDRVEVTGLTRTSPDFITRRLGSRAGEPLREDVVHDDIERIHQIGEFEAVGVRIVEDAGGTTLKFEAREKSWGPGYMRFGIGVEGSPDGDSDFRAIVNYRRPEINRKGGEWKTVLLLGSTFSVNTELFQPLSLGGIHWFVAPNLSYTKEQDERFLPGGALEDVETNTFEVGLDTGVQFRNWGEIRVGARRGTLDGKVSTESMFPDFDVDVAGWSLKATLDQLDSVFFPKNGSFVELRGFFSREALGADVEYDKVSLRMWNTWGGKRDTFVGGLEYGEDLGTDIPFYDEFELGGFLNLSGFTRGELRGDVKTLASLGYYRQVAELGVIGRRLYVGAYLQSGNVWTDQEEVDLGNLVSSGTFFVGLDTVFAPVYLGWGTAEGDQNEFYFFIGRPF